MVGAAIVGVLGLGLAVLSAWLHIKNKDGSGWGLMAFILIVTSCSKAGG
jgi:hypothetical protein